MKAKFLLDENISPKTVLFLHSLGLEVIGIREVGLQGKSDEIIYGHAKENGFVLVTYDHEFGHVFHYRKDLEGLILLKVHPQTLETLHPVLKRFFESIKERNVDIRKTIVVIEKFRFRIRKIK
jgi:predicted nuclease of predicted toxin-antitoxin system